MTPQAHSLLWDYLWLAPHILALALVGVLLRREFRRHYPIFCTYLLFAGVEGLCLFALDVSPKVDPVAWWQALWVGTVIEGILKFAVIGELLHRQLRSWPSIAKLGRNLVSGAGVLLVFLAAVAAAFSAHDNAPWYIGSIHVLFQTIYFAAAGLILSLFVLAAWLHIPWERQGYGIAFGAGLVWCEHLAMWALVAGGILRNSPWIDIANMATYHVSVLIWSYYLLTSERKSLPKDDSRHRHDDSYDPPNSGPSSGEPDDHEETLNDWNRELERLIHQ